MVEPRRLSDVAEETLFEQLSKFTNKGVAEIDSVEGDHEGAKFAHQIQQVFKKAGWEAGRVERYAYTGLAPTGLLLTVQPDNRPYAKALGTIFNAAGFSVRFSKSPTLGSSTARVTVGIKPQ